MNIVVAPDSFKECLSSRDVALAISRGILDVMPTAKVFNLPVSDGGEGMLDAIVSSTGGDSIFVEVLDPLLRPIMAQYAIVQDGRTAIIEMAKASGLELLSEEEKNPLLTSTYGAGQLIKDGLDRGCTKIIIGIGGSATNDGGMGLARALGAKFLNDQGEELPDGGGSLEDLRQIDLSRFDKRILGCEVLVACDVTNPLTGPHGASMVYGGQKGANQTDLHRLDKNLAHYAVVIKQCLGVDVVDVPGSGAAGGTGAAIISFLNGSLVSGIELVLETVGMEKFIRKADLVITGEGRIDGQTLQGKTISGIAKMAKKHQVPVIVLTGKIEHPIDAIYKIGVTAVYAIANRPMTLKEGIGGAAVLLEECTNNIMRTIDCFRAV